MILIHSTHEAGFKVGGIGAVLDGLLTAPSYLAGVERTLLVGTMNTADPTEMERLFAPRNRLRPRYLTGRDATDCPPALVQALAAVERDWNARLLYGTRAFGPAEHEVILVDAAGLTPDRLNLFKYLVWERFGLECARYDHEYEFNLYMRGAQPAFAALQAVLGEDAPAQAPVPPSLPPAAPTLLCHEFMGLPLWYAAEISRPGVYRSAYVAHEVPTARALVEGDRGHDTRFYTAMRRARQAGLYAGEVFGDQSAFFKHGMVLTASRCDRLLAVGDRVVDELRFLGPQFDDRPIDVVYNGVNSRPARLADVSASRRKLQSYAQALTGLEPAFIFSHVSRVVLSKGLWRDIRVMEELDGLLAARGESAVLFVVATIIPQGRSTAEVERMSREYGWPREHREGWPDLYALESPLWHAMAAFNATARASRIVFVNQFGFSRDRVGDSMPPDLTFEDLRRGSDLEFGQSIYEPFGIAQVEPLPYCALCVVSDVCGCIGFARAQLAAEPRFAGLDEPGAAADPGASAGADAFDDDRRPFLNLVIADYTRLPAAGARASWREALHIGQMERDAVERDAARDAALRLVQRLPRNETQKQMLLDDGLWLAQRMSWEVVAREQLLPVLHNPARAGMPARAGRRRLI